MVDLYTKIVLTVIAFALCAIAIRGPGMFGPALAQGATCGDTPRDACYVTGTIDIVGKVEISNKVKIDTGMFGLPVQVHR